MCPRLQPYVSQVLSLHTWTWSQPHISVDHCTPPLCSSATLTALGGGALLLLGGSQHKQASGLIEMPHGHGMGTAWARHGHGMGTAWARHGHSMGMAWAWHGHGR